MKKTMNILEFYEFLKDKPNGEYRAILNDKDDTLSLYTSSRDGYVWNRENGDTCRLNDTFTVDIPDFMPNWDSVKEVEYFGKKLLLSKDTKWLATDKIGEVWGYSPRSKPKCDENLGYFYSPSGRLDEEPVMTIEYNGDWTKSLLEV